MPSCVHYLRTRYGGNCLFYTFSELAEIGQNLVGLTYSDDSPGRQVFNLFSSRGGSKSRCPFILICLLASQVFYLPLYVFHTPSDGRFIPARHHAFAFCARAPVRTKTQYEQNQGRPAGSSIGSICPTTGTTRQAEWHSASHSHPVTISASSSDVLEVVLQTSTPSAPGSSACGVGI